MSYITLRFRSCFSVVIQPADMIRVCKKLGHIMKNVTVSEEKSYATVQIAPLQKAALKERCILVDKSDRSIGEATKEVCHEVNAQGTVPLHRAFSVFLFNDKRELLVQKRSSNKVKLAHLIFVTFTIPRSVDKILLMLYNRYYFQISANNVYNFDVSKNIYVYTTLFM